MGFRLFNNIGMIPAEIKDGTIYVEDELLAPIKLPSNCGAIQMPKQCNYVANSSICCYMKNQIYEIIIWNDGTVGVYTAGTRYQAMLSDKNAVHVPTLNNLIGKVSYGGLFSEYKAYDGDIGGQAFLIKANSGRHWLVASGSGTVFKGVKENQYYMFYRNSVLIPSSPYIYLEGNKAMCNAYGKVFELEFEQIINARSQYKLGGVS